MPRQTVLRSEKEKEELKRIRRERNTEIQRLRRQKLRDQKKEQEEEEKNAENANSIDFGKLLLSSSKNSFNEEIKEKRRQRNTELQRLRRANLHIPERRRSKSRPKKTAEEEEAYLERRRKRNTEIQRMRRKKLREEKKRFTESDGIDNNANHEISTFFNAFLQACISAQTNV